MADYQQDFKITKCNEHHRHRDWSALPDGILCDISSRLFFMDYYSFANVCTSWRSAAPFSPEMPFLFLHKQGFRPRPSFQLLNITSNVSKDVHIPLLGSSKVCIGSQYGWLMLVDYTLSVISLYNPFSRQEIKLRSHVRALSWMFPTETNTKDISISKVVLSCAPTSTSPFPAVAVLLDTGHVIYKQKGACGWRRLLFSFIQDITSVRGKFAAILVWGNVYIFDPDMHNPEFVFTCAATPDPNYPLAYYYKHLVNLNNDLLQVWWLIDPQTQATITVKIMLLDFEYRIWIPVDDLRGHSLFLSTSHSFSLSSQRIPGLKDNLVYFMDGLWEYHRQPDMINWKRKVGVFDMTNGTYEIFPLPNTRLPPTTLAFWYLPPSF